MAIDPGVFSQIANLDAETAKELVETVTLAIRMNPKLACQPREKITLAFELLGCITGLFESCNCTVATVIENPSWRNPLGYKTGFGSGELTNDLDNVMDNLDDILGG